MNIQFNSFNSFSRIINKLNKIWIHLQSVYPIGNQIEYEFVYKIIMNKKIKQNRYERS